MRKARMLWQLCLFGILLIGTNAYAQSEDDQLLIFRNTGEVNLLYQSEIDSIMFTKVDTLGAEYDTPIAQVFYAKDTTLYVSIAEIDSVCFGSRNEIEYKKDVRILSADPDMSWIIRYDGQNIYYKTSTPSNILPQEGQKLYFPEQTEIFPVGLCAVVDKVTRGDSEIAVAVSSVEYTEIFSKFFYAGDFEGIGPAVSRAGKTRSTDFGEEIGLNMSLGLDGLGEFGTYGKLGVSGKLVMNPLKKYTKGKGYYHADVDFFVEVGLNAKVTAKESTSKSFVRDISHTPLGTVAGVFIPSVDVGLFCDVKAELAFEFAMKRSSTLRISWTRRGNEQSFERHNPSEPGQQVNEAKAQIILNGSVYAGLKVDFNFALVGDFVGATARVKNGPEINGELSMGVLRDLSKNYNASLYGKGKLDFANKFQIEGLIIHRSLFDWHNIVETKFYEYSLSFGHKEIDLFPKLSAPKAVVAPKKKKVSVAVKSNNAIAHEVKTGFQILKTHPDNSQTTSPQKEVFVKDIVPTNENKVQGVSTEMDLPQSMVNADHVYVRTVFKYADHTIPHLTTDAAQNPNIQPIIVGLSNGVSTVVSGVPIVGNVKKENTQYHIGPFVMIPYHDKTFHKEPPYVGIGGGWGYIYYEDASTLVGNWVGEIDNQTITIAFESNGDCKYTYGEFKLDDAEYELNEPQAGFVTISEGASNIVFEILSMTSSTMTVRFKNSDLKGKKCTLNRE